MASFGSEIPDDLLSLIIAKFVENCSLTDHVRFPAVCAEWNKAFCVDHNLQHIKLPAQLRLLMFVTSNKDHSIRSFYSLSERTVLNFQVQLPPRRIVRNSSSGWLVMIDVSIKNRLRSTVWLHNPFKSVNNDIRLPPLAPMYNPIGDHQPRPSYRWITKYLKKAILSANPSSSSSPNSNDHGQLVIMAISTSHSSGHHGLMFCKPSDSAWNCFTSPYESSHGGFEDVIYYKGQFHGVLKSGLVVAFDTDSLHYRELRHTIVAQPPNKKLVGFFPWVRIYLVESSGDLLQVHRHGINPNRGCYTTVGFKVFKLLRDGGPVVGSFEANDEWVVIHSLNGRMMFLGDNASLSLLASDFPGCKSNCIYFNDDHARYSKVRRTGEVPDCGAFNLEDGVLERFPINYQQVMDSVGRKFIKPPTPEPTWIEMMI